MRGAARFLIILGAVALGAACTASGGTARAPAETAPTVPRGGTLRLAMPAFATGQFDPTTIPFDTTNAAQELHRCCLLRTLFSYYGRPTEQGGTQLHPDLAVAMPEVSTDGLTWTVHIKEGIDYAPPFQDTEIVSKDFVRALSRLGDPKVSTDFASYYSVIEGFDEYVAGKATTIVGLGVPTDHTLLIRLDEPAGDLPFRFALPASAPVPPGAADGHPTDYFQYLVASGPYMIEGSEALDFSRPPDEQVSVAGFVPGKSLMLVRNPSWRGIADDLRPAYVDRIQFTFFRYPGSLKDLRRTGVPEQVESGGLDISMFPLPPGLVRRYEADPDLRDQLHVGLTNGLFYLPINLAVPPFDDVHVRRALNLVVNKEALRAYWDFSLPQSRLASHIAPDSLLDNLLLDYRPSWMRGSTGSLRAARAEMRLSSYDRDHDGRCDHVSCHHVSTVGYYQRFLSIVRPDLHRIGLTLEDKRVGFSSFFNRIGTPRERIALLLAYNAWYATYPNGSDFFTLLHGSEITETSNANTSLLGATPQQLRAWGYRVTAVPSVDTRIERCLALVGPSQTGCWADLDLHLMEEVVPWVSLFVEGRFYPVSGRVVHFSFDQSTSFPAFDQIALSPGSS